MNNKSRAATDQVKIKLAPRHKSSSPFVDSIIKNTARIQESEYEAKSDDAKSPRHRKGGHAREFKD